MKFPFLRQTACLMVFTVEKLKGRSAARIFSAYTTFMVVNTFIQVIGDTCVERFISA
jgi:hypothetical protein